MKRQWIRLWVKVRTDPKVQRLPAPVFKFWINLLCWAGERDQPDVTRVTHEPYSVFARPDHVLKWFDVLIKFGLIDLKPGPPVQYIIHDWDEYQYDSDSSTERVKRFRERKRNVSVTLESRAEAEQIRKEQSIPPSAELQLPPPAAPLLTQIIPFAAAACLAAPQPQRSLAEKALLLRFEDIRHADNPEGFALTILQDFGIRPPPRKKRQAANSGGSDYDELAAEIARHKTLPR